MKPGFHSSKHRKEARMLLRNFKASFKAAADSDSEDEDIREDAEDHDGAESDTNSCVSMISACQSFAPMGIYPNHPDIAIDAALIDTGSSHLSTMGELLGPSTRATSGCKKKPDNSKGRISEELETPK